MQITIKGGADFSAAGLGNVNWIESYIALNSGMSGTQKTALRAFYTSYINAGFTGKFDVLRVFFNVGTNNFDKLNLLNVNSHAGTFNNDLSAAHTLSGYQFNSAANRYLTSDMALTLADLANFHMHAYTTTNEDLTNGYIMGYYNNSNPSNPLIALQRKGSDGNTRGTVNVNSAYSVTVAGHTAINKLLSLAKNGTSQKLYDDGTVLGSATVSPAIVFPSPTISIFEGAVAASTGTNCKVLFMAYGRSAWTDADETNLNSMINTFKTAIGA